MTKSYVSLEQKICPVCGETFDSGSILMDKKLRNSFEHKTVTRYGLCPEDEKRNSEGYIALIVVNNQGQDKTITLDKANRTGEIVHIKREVFTELFNRPCPTEPFVFIDKNLFTFLESLQCKQ
jgi:hypothetical protein